MTKTVLITGASSGLGAEFAKQYAQQGYQLILVARRLNLLNALIAELSQFTSAKMVAISCDLSLTNAAQQLMENLNQYHADTPIDILVNNAGYSIKTNFENQSLLQIQAQLNVMLVGVTELTHFVLPHMQAQQFGRIINVSSLAAYAPPGAGTLYSAIKQYVLSFSQSVHLSVRNNNIYVTALCPGFTHTGFHQAMNVQQEANQIPRFMWGNAAQVVSECITQNNAGKAVVVPRAINKFIAFSSKRLPETARLYLGQYNLLGE